VDEKITKSSENKKDKEICDNKNNNLINTNGLIEKNSTSPVPLIKKHILTKNWLISDIAKGTPESMTGKPSTKPPFQFPFSISADQENSNALNLIRVEDLVNKKHSVNIPFRPKPVTELLKRIRETGAHSPDSNKEQFKTELDEEKFRAGEFSSADFSDGYSVKIALYLAQ
jgi:hypothetical protein